MGVLAGRLRLSPSSLESQKGAANGGALHRDGRCFRRVRRSALSLAVLDPPLHEPKLLQPLGGGLREQDDVAQSLISKTIDDRVDAASRRSVVLGGDGNDQAGPRQIS